MYAVCTVAFVIIVIAGIAILWSWPPQIVSPKSKEDLEKAWKNPGVSFNKDEWLLLALKTAEKAQAKVRRRNRRIDNLIAHCKYCEFFKEPYPKNFICKRYPPVFCGTHFQYPTVCKNTPACGDYQRKERGYICD
jgi:hypothetical protein